MNVGNDSNMQKLRSGEFGEIPQRSHRFFEQQGYWYFRTREGMDIGPYDQHDAAVEGLNGFLSFLQQTKEDVVTRITKYIKLQPRVGESIEIPSRTDRIFSQGDYWYYRTREGMDIGPFDSRGEAALGVKAFIGFLQESQPEVVSRVTSYIQQHA